MIWLILHFLLLLLVNSRLTFFALRQEDTVSPRFMDPLWIQAEGITSVALGDEFAASNPLRQAVAVYTHGAGIESGYGFFAPSVSVSYKLVFELKYPDGRIEYELPYIGGAASSVRLPLLFDKIARTRYRPLRETMLRMMAYAIWREHPDATVVRPVFGLVNLPSLSAFEQGKKESYEFLFAYDFRFSSPAPKVTP